MAVEAHRTPSVSRDVRASADRISDLGRSISERAASASRKLRLAAAELRRAQADSRR
jgi:hypothetical protein